MLIITYISLVTIDPDSSNSLPITAVVACAIVLVIIIILTILVLIIIKKGLLKKTQQPSVIRLSTVNHFITADINIESNPMDVETKSNPTGVKMEKSSPKNLKTIKDPADIKMQNNPAYQNTKEEYSYKVKDNYYY